MLRINYLPQNQEKLCSKLSISCLQTLTRFVIRVCTQARCRVTTTMVEIETESTTESHKKTDFNVNLEAVKLLNDIHLHKNMNDYHMITN